MSFQSCKPTPFHATGEKFKYEWVSYSVTEITWKLSILWGGTWITLLLQVWPHILVLWHQAEVMVVDKWKEPRWGLRFHVPKIENDGIPSLPASRTLWQVPKQERHHIHMILAFFFLYRYSNSKYFCYSFGIFFISKPQQNTSPSYQH